MHTTCFLQTIVIIMSLSFVGFVTILHIIGKVTEWLSARAGVHVCSLP